MLKLITLAWLALLLATHAATVSFSNIPSTNTVNSDDLLLLDSHLGGTNYATRTVTVSLIPTANWTADGTTNSTLAGMASPWGLSVGGAPIPNTTIFAGIAGTNEWEIDLQPFPLTNCLLQSFTTNRLTYALFPSKNYHGDITSAVGEDSYGDAVGTAIRITTAPDATGYAYFIEALDGDMDHWGSASYNELNGINFGAWNRTAVTTNGIVHGGKFNGYVSGGSVDAVYGLEAGGSTYGGTVREAAAFRALFYDTKATNNYDFLSELNSGTGKWAFYGKGTAPSHFGGAVDTASSYTSGAPSGGTAAAWKLGSWKTNAVTVIATNYVEVEIGGVLRKLAVVQ